ncbi:MAG: hypothetical protein FRX49_13468 [Trebouxia sp. A1-2]|nr:MAG: hypothetical protein FRX49_13468 [Trebouxia sp. A1-2]
MGYTLQPEKKGIWWEPSSRPRTSISSGVSPSSAIISSSFCHASFMYDGLITARLIASKKMLGPSLEGGARAQVKWQQLPRPGIEARESRYLERIASTQAPESSSSWGGEKTTVFWKSTLLILAVEQAAEVNKLLVGNVFIVNAHSLPLTTEEVGPVLKLVAAFVNAKA